MTATNLDFSDSVRRFNRRARGRQTSGEGLASFAQELMQEARLDYQDNRSADALLAIQLLPSIPDNPWFVPAKNVLYPRMFLRWNKTDVLETETVLAKELLVQPSIFGPSPQVEAWDGAIDAAMEKCFDAPRLKRLIKLARGNDRSTLRTKALQRLVGLMEPMEQEFMANSFNALGQNPNSLRLVAKNSIAYIRRLSQLAEWKFGMATSIIHLENEQVRITHPDTIEVIGDLKQYGSSRNTLTLIDENLNENEKRVRAAWEKLEKPRGSSCIVRLVVNGVIRTIILH